MLHSKYCRYYQQTLSSLVSELTVRSCALSGKRDKGVNTVPTLLVARILERRRTNTIYPHCTILCLFVFFILFSVLMVMMS